MRAHRPNHGPIRRIAIELRYVEDVETAWWFFRWFVTSLGRWLQRRRWNRRPKPAQRITCDISVPLIKVVGERAQAVFAKTPVKTHKTNGISSLHVVDDASQVCKGAPPSIVLRDSPRLSIPAFDPTVFNPIGWRRKVENRVAALGPCRELPRTIKVHHTVDITDHYLLHRCHHIRDVATFHRGPIDRAGTLVRVAALGTPICLADDAPELQSLLGDELYDLMATDIRGANLEARQSASIQIRRLALRDHSWRGRLRQMHEAALTLEPTVPSVSILMATRRPDFLPWAIANVAKQNYPRLELVLALHGDDFDLDTVDRHLKRLSHPASVVRVGADQPMDAVLNAATSRANGSLLAKMDDDDLYDAHHVWDLVLAHEYSGADLVGKGLETIYLHGLNKTIQLPPSSEVYSPAIAGGTMLIAASLLDRLGGWEHRPNAVDRALIERVLDDNGSVFRTHGAGYIYFRHGVQHAWQRGDSEFLARAVRVSYGWKPSFADMDDVQPYLLNA